MKQLINQIITSINCATSFQLDSNNYFIQFHGDSEIMGKRICKKIVIYTDDKKRKYVVKAYYSKDYLETLENQMLFSELLRANGIATPKRVALGNDLIMKMNFSDKIICVTMEEYMEGNHFRLSFDSIIELTKLIAKTHLISEKNHFRVGDSTHWYNISKKNQIMRFDKFLVMKKMHHALFEKDIKTYNRIEKKANDVLERINELVSNLPIYGVHGDLTEDNLIISTEKSNQILLIDFDQAGDCCLISDFVLQSSFWIELCGPISNDDFFKISNSLIEVYKSIRETSSLELGVAKLLFGMTRAFYFQRVESYIKKGETLDLSTYFFDNEMKHIEECLDNCK